jgi:tetratricopeptide (TPR) repeat protein
MDKTLNEFVKDPHNDEAAFNLANFYFNQKQTSSALTYFLRVTECSSDDNLIYESLLKAGLCIEKQGNRAHSTKGLYLHAISHLPQRPEAYFLLSRLYEWSKEWQESYSMSSLAESVCKFDFPNLKTNVEYPGRYGFKFEKAVCSWWMGRLDESINLFLDLHKNEKMDESHTNAVKQNITFMWGEGDYSNASPLYYDSTRLNDLKYKFKGAEKIKNNQSQVFQDIFTLMMLDGKTNGKYLEIGAHEPITHSNTYILEKDFNWKGISLEIDSNLVNKFNGVRSNHCILQDATVANYNKILNDTNWGEDWDYLQLDCEPPRNTFEALLSIPFEKYRFAVITYEHDYYCDETKSYRDKSRAYLVSRGYKLVVDNISSDGISSFEDWWVHPNLVNKEILNKLKSLTNQTQNASKYIYNE